MIILFILDPPQWVNISAVSTKSVASTLSDEITTVRVVA